MKVNYIPATITLLAGAVTCIYSIVDDWDTLRALETLLGVLIVFYIIGTVAMKIIVRVMESNRVTKTSKEEEDTEEVKEEEEQTVQEENAD